MRRIARRSRVRTVSRSLLLVVVVIVEVQLEIEVGYRTAQGGPLGRQLSAQQAARKLGGICRVGRARAGAAQAGQDTMEQLVDQRACERLDTLALGRLQRGQPGAMASEFGVAKLFDTHPDVLDSRYQVEP